MIRFALALSALAVMPATAHEFYDTWCCNGNAHSGDCQPIPSASVKPVDGGYQITLGPGDHRLATRVHVFSKAQAETRRSLDGRYHACLYPTEDTLRCLYIPPAGF